MPSPLPSLQPYSASHTPCLSPSSGQWSPIFLWACLPSLAGAFWCCAVLCCAVLCCAVLCCAVLCCAVLCCAVLCCAVRCGAVPPCAVLCHPVLCQLVLYWLVYAAMCHAPQCQSLSNLKPWAECNTLRPFDLHHMSLPTEKHFPGVWGSSHLYAMYGCCGMLCHAVPRCAMLWPMSLWA